MKDLLSKFENKQPEIVFTWKEAETEAEGWELINSLRGDTAGSGTRMCQGLAAYKRNKNKTEITKTSFEIALGQLI